MSVATGGSEIPDESQVSGQAKSQSVFGIPGIFGDLARACVRGIHGRTQHTCLRNLCDVEMCKKKKKRKCVQNFKYLVYLLHVYFPKQVRQPYMT